MTMAAIKFTKRSLAGTPETYTLRHATAQSRYGQIGPIDTAFPKPRTTQFCHLPWR